MNSLTTSAVERKPNVSSYGRSGSRLQVVKRSPLVSAHVEMADHTGPVDLIRGKRILVLADTQNIDYSARNLGFKASWELLGKWIERAGAKAYRHAFISQWDGDNRRASYFEARGWTPHIKRIEIVKTCRGSERDSNVDNLMLFYAGLLVSRANCDAVLILSGDGNLVWDLAASVRTMPKSRQVFTMSLAGSTSWRLNAVNNDIIDGNIEIGKDCLRPRDDDRNGWR